MKNQLQLREASASPEPLAPMASYEQYRAFCDQETDGFRRTGLLSEAGYNEALSDPKTIFCIANEIAYPALSPINYEPRYDATRTQELTGKNVLLLTAPLSQVRAGALSTGKTLGGHNLTPDIAVLVEDTESKVPSDYSRDQEDVARALRGLGNFAIHEFVHPDLEERANNRTAWMGIYSFSFSPAETREVSDPDLSPEQAFQKAWYEYCIENNLPTTPVQGADGTYLCTAQQFREDPELVESLWQISEAGFGKILGAYHPISMEVTHEFFEQQLMTEDMFTAVRVYEGKPVCFGSLALNMRHNDWLNCDSTIVKQDLDEAEQRGEITAHFFELISNAHGISLSPDVLRLFLDLAGRTGRAYHVMFESTNLSDLYIPKIASRQLARSDKVVQTSEVKRLDRLHYWWLSEES